MINLQVMTNYAAPEGAKRVLLHARDGEGQEGPCQNCGGRGTLERGDACRRCAGAGSGKWVTAVRWDINTEKDRETALTWLDSLPVGTRRQTTLRLTEHGTGLTNTGHSQIVCGLNGERLVSMGGHNTMNSPHAIFFVFEALVVDYTHHRGVGSGRVTHVRVGPRLAEEHVVLFRYSDVDAITVETETLIAFPSEALAAARRKACCYHCRSAHYALGRSAQGPSGALRGAGAAWGGLPSPLKGPGLGYDPDPA